MRREWDMRNVYRILVGKTEEDHHSEDLAVGGGYY
jgi:hypothetical protein